MANAINGNRNNEFGAFNTEQDMGNNAFGAVNTKQDMGNNEFGAFDEQNEVDYWSQPPQNEA